MANFIIIKYKIEMPLLSIGVCWQWAMVTAFGRTARIKDIERAEALKLIKDYGLKLMHQDENGKVWDDGSFRQTYGGYINFF